MCRRGCGVDARNRGHLAVLRYDDARAHPTRAAVLAFHESAYRAGASHAGWDIERLASPGGITDPYLLADGGQRSRVSVP